MYKVLCDGALMCDSRIEELALINPVVKPEENKAGSFSFTIPPAHPMYDAVTKRKSLIEVYRDNEEEPLFCGVCIEEKKDFYKQKTISCEGELTFFNDSVQRPARYQGVTVRGLLEAYIAAHNAQVEEAKRFTVGQVTVTDPNNYLYCYTNMESTMKALKKDLVDDLGGFFRIRHEGGIRYIDYLAESPNTNSQEIKIGKNLMDFTTNIDSSKIATAIIPLGAKLEETTVEGLEVRLTIKSVNEGLDYVYSAEAVEAYGWIYKTVEWDEVTTPEALKQKGEQYLSDIQFENMVIQAKAVDLHLADKQIERFKISDQIRVVSAPHGLNRYFRLTKQTINLNNPEKDTVTLGKDERLSLTAKSNQASEEIKKAIAEIVPADHILKNAIANATQLITQSMNGYITIVMNKDGSPKELLIMDTTDTKTATKVWRWNINGLGYSPNGYNGDYVSAMTMDGDIVGDRIAVNSISANKLKIKCVEQGNVSSEISTEKGTVSIKGNRLEIESDNFTLTKDGTVSATGEFTTSKKTEEGLISRTKMVGTGVGVYKYAEGEDADNEVLCAQLGGVAGEKSGSLTLRKNGKRDATLAAGAERGLQVWDSTGEKTVASVYRDPVFDVGEIALYGPVGTDEHYEFFHAGQNAGNYYMKFMNWFFNNGMLFVDDKIILQSQDGTRIGYFDKLGDGAKTLGIEWVWDETLSRYVLCSKL